jgi:hypothetical protein
MVRIDSAADDSLAEIRARSKFGTAMAAITRIMATTMSSSMRENPLCFRIFVVPISPRNGHYLDL